MIKFLSLFLVLFFFQTAMAGHDQDPGEVNTLDAQTCFDQLKEKTDSLSHDQVPDPIETQNDYTPFNEATYYMYVVEHPSTYLSKQEQRGREGKISINMINEILLEEYGGEKLPNCNEVAESTTQIIWDKLLNSVVAFRSIESTTACCFILP